MIRNQAFYPSKCNFKYEWNPEFVGRAYQLPDHLYGITVEGIYLYDENLNLSKAKTKNRQNWTVCTVQCNCSHDFVEPGTF